MSTPARATLALALFALTLAAAGCNDDDDDFFTVGTAPTVGGVAVTDARESPATLEFVLTDAESDPASARVVFFEAGAGAPTFATLQGAPPLDALRTAPGGMAHVLEWDFETDLGGAGFRDGITVRVELLDGIQSVLSTAVASNVAVGNDAPTENVLSPFTAPQTGLVPLDFEVADSSGDPVDVRVEFDVVGDVPDAGFRPARPFGLAGGAPTPNPAFQGVAAPSGGAILSFSWDSRFDLGSTDTSARLRVTADDGLLTGAGATSPTVVLDNNASGALGIALVADTRESPASVTFDLVDMEGDPQRVALSFLRPGSTTAEPLTLAQPDPLDGLAADPGGVTHTRLWDFAADLGSTAYEEGFTVLVDLLEGSTVLATRQVLDVAVGNDAPEAVAVVSAPAGEVTGDVDVTVEVADSSDDLVNVRVEYDVVGDSPDAGFRTARPAGLAPGSPTPPFAVVGLPADRTGVDVDFAWDARADLGATELSAVLRFTAEDDLVVGGPLATGVLDLDNNGAPRAELDMPVLDANADGVRGVPVPFRVFDDESDTVDVFLQWRPMGEPFPALPTDADALRAALRDPGERRRLQVGSRYPPAGALGGRIVPVDPAADPTGTRVELPELASGGLGVAAGDPGLLALELLRAGLLPEPTGHPWSLARPVGAVPLGATTALVLDSDGGGAWRLRELDLTTGAELRQVASGTQGDPAALDLQPERADRALVAVGDGTTWSVLGVDLVSGAVDVLVPTVHAPVIGTVRDLVGVDGAHGYLTVGSTLVRVNADPAATQLAVPILGGFDGAFGLALDPADSGRLLVAERGVPGDPSAPGGVWAVDLVTLARTRALPLTPELANPRDLGFAPDGSRIAVVVEGDPADAALELRTFSFDDGGSAALGALTDETSRVSLGADGLVVVALPDADDLAVGGGVEQVRGVAAIELAARVAVADAPFDPPPTPGSRWRLSRAVDRVVADVGGERGTFLWDARDAGRTEDVAVRVVALDGDVATSLASSERAVVAPLDVAAEALGAGYFVEPSLVAAADLDGDGRRELAVVDLSRGTLDVLARGENGFAPAASAALAGSAFTDLAVADVTADGALDLLVASPGALELVPGGPGLALGAPTLVDGAGATALAVGDIDRDGRTDFAAADAAGDSVRLFFGTSSGLRATSDLTLSGLGGPVDVALADLTGDGDLDLVVAEGSAGDLAVFLQGAPQDFGPAPTTRLAPPSASALPTALLLADLDGDGARDVAAAYGGSDAVALRFQVAPGAFDAAPTVLGGGGTTPDPRGLAARDADGDGDLDLFVSLGSDELAIFTQGARGELSPVPDLLLSLAEARGFVLDDLDGDGRLDLAAAGGSTGEVQLFRQGAGGDFAAAPVALANPAASERAFFVEPGDFDGDGDLDLALAARPDGNVALHLQSEPGVFVPSPAGPVADGELPVVSSLAAGDLDGDGDVDLAAAISSRNRIGLLLQTAPGLLELDLATGLVGSDGRTPRPRSVDVADVDADGDLDLVVAAGDPVKVFAQGAPGDFPDRPALTLGSIATTRRPQEVLAVDLDGDGDVDIASANLGHPTKGTGTATTVFLQGPAGFASTPDLTLGLGDPQAGVRSVAAGDLDGDGDLDLVAAHEGAGALFVFEQTGPGAFDPAGVPLAGPGPFAPLFVRAADLDGDGDDDLLCANGATGRTAGFRQASPGVFLHDGRLELSLAAPAGATVAFAVADVDLDGDLDVVTADSTAGVQTVRFGGR